MEPDLLKSRMWWPYGMLRIKPFVVGHSWLSNCLLAASEILATLEEGARGGHQGYLVVEAWREEGCRIANETDSGAQGRAWAWDTGMTCFTGFFVDKMRLSFKVLNYYYLWGQCRVQLSDLILKLNCLDSNLILLFCLDLLWVLRSDMESCNA